MEEISLTELFLILRKRIQIIILITIISIVTSAIVSFFILDPQYQTFTTLMVGKPKDYQSYNDRLDYNEVLLNQKLVSTYGELVKTRAVADEVIRNLNLDISYETFKDKINVNLVKDTEIIRLEVIDEDPELAVEIANETAEVFMKKVRNIMRVENIQVIDEAQIPDKPVKPKPMLNMAIAGVLGLMIGVFITFLLEFLDNTIKTPDDVKRHLELPVLGTIPMVEEK